MGSAARWVCKIGGCPTTTHRWPPVQQQATLGAHSYLTMQVPSITGEVAGVIYLTVGDALPLGNLRPNRVRVMRQVAAVEEQVPWSEFACAVWAPKASLRIVW
jgi:hypothetical protein